MRSRLDSEGPESTCELGETKRLLGLGADESSPTNSAIEHYPTVRPDIMVIAKGIANGFPLSGIVSRKELMDLQKPGSMGGTYAGNAVSCAAAIAVQEVFEEEKILDNVATRGEELFGLLNELKADKEIGNTIAEVRGLGLVSSFLLLSHIQKT